LKAPDPAVQSEKITKTIKQPDVENNGKLFFNRMLKK